MGKKTGFEVKEHAALGDYLANVHGTLQAFAAEVDRAYSKASPQAKAAAKVDAAMRAYRDEMETAAHRERVPNSMAVYHLDTLAPAGTVGYENGEAVESDA